MDDPDASDLHQAVVVEGQPLSLRPVYQESLAYSSFAPSRHGAPVLQRVGEDRWQVGIQGHGRTAEITATPGEAARQAQELYARWAENDDETWEKRTAQVLKLDHFDAWAAQFGDTVTAMEMKPSGEGYREYTRFARFNNVPELLRAFAEVAERLASYAQSLDIEVSEAQLPGQRQGESHGGKVVLRQDATPLDRAATLAPEVAHELMHGPEQRVPRRRRLNELEAEACAYVVCQHFGYEM